MAKRTTRKTAKKKTTKKTAARRAPRRTTKKAPRKKVAPKKAAASAGGVQVGKPQSTADVKFRKPSHDQPSMYDSVLEGMAGLAAGQTLPVAIPDGVDAKTMHNRLNSLFRRVKPTPTPKGCVFRKRTMEDGKHIAISCVKEG